jgi:hypothetical protein
LEAVIDLFDLGALSCGNQVGRAERIFAFGLKAGEHFIRPICPEGIGSEEARNLSVDDFLSDI